MHKRIPLILKTHHSALKTLSKAHGRNFQIIVNNTPSMIKAIKTLCQQILKGSLNMKKEHIKKLKPHRAIIRKVAHDPHKLVKATIQRGGSILKTILNIILPILPVLFI